jgi:hypothetical protein
MAQAEALRPVFDELQELSANGCAAELNARGITAPNGGRWFAMQVIRFRDRLARAWPSDSRRSLRHTRCSDRFSRCRSPSYTGALIWK